MKRLLGTTLFIVASIALALNAGSASAQDQIHVSPAVQAAAPNIVNGHVVSTESVVLDGQPHRVSEIAITTALKGDLTGSVLVETLGGELGDGRTMHVSHVPYLLPGDDVQVALAETPGIAGVGLAVAVNPDLEVYSVVGDIDGAFGLLPDGGGTSDLAGDFRLEGISWGDFDDPIEFRVNPNHSGVSENGTINAVKRGFQMWEDDPGSHVDFEYGGTTNKSNFDLGDSYVGVSWVYPPGGASWIAQAQWVSGPDGNTAAFDIRLNRNLSFANGEAWNKTDIGSVIGHEVGHGIGIAHSSTWSDLMYFQLAPNQIKPLGPGDRAAVAHLYPRVDAYCAGRLVTVNLNYGEMPTSGDDVILGTSGDDVIDARAGDDIICAGAGFDIVHGGHGDDRIEGGRQGDYLYGDQGNDRLIGGSGNDRLFGGGDNDTLFGNSGNDKLYGSYGIDTLRGGDGRDTLHGDHDGDKLYGGDDNDRLYGGDDDDRLYGDDGADLLNGSDGDDELYGGADGDELNGSRGNDMLDGGGGNDDLDGGSNVDDCDGAAGVDSADRCEFRTSAG